MIKAIIFDYFGVICSDHYWTMVGRDKNNWQDNTEFYNLANKVNLGHIHWQEFMNLVAQRTHKGIAEVEKMYREEGIDPRIIALVRQFNQLGYKTALLTNAHHEFLEPVFKYTGVDKLFNEIVISSKVGIIKPDLKIYNLVLAKLKIKPEEAIFIDDNQQNVDAAKSLGMVGLFYDGDYQLLKDRLSKLL